MTLQEIIAAESCNTDRIYLYPEGVFWKAYERSAFAFVRRISRYKITKRFVKYLDTEIVSLGFPDTSRDRILGDRPTRCGPYGVLVLDGGTIDPEAFDRWKETIPAVASRDGSVSVRPAERPLSAPPPADGATFAHRVTVVEPARLAAAVAGETATDCPPGVAQVLRDLRNFSVENATPLECLLFVSSLKKQLNGHI